MLEPKNPEVYRVKALLLGCQDLLAQAQIAYSQLAALDKSMVCYTGEPLFSARSALTIVAVLCRAGGDMSPAEQAQGRGTGRERGPHLHAEVFCRVRTVWTSGQQVPTRRIRCEATNCFHFLLILYQAIKAFSKALKLNPLNKKAASYLATALAGQQRHEEVVAR